VSLPVSLLHETCRLERVAPGVHERTVDRTWWGHEAQFGGYVQALALTAMGTELDDPSMSPVTNTMQFFRPFVEGRLRAEVSVERHGRTMANVLARLFMDGKLSGLATAMFGARRAAAEFTAIAPPAAVREGPPPPREDPIVPALGVPVHERFAFYPRIGAFAVGAGDAHVGGWVRWRVPAPVDELTMVMLGDLWIPAAYHHWSVPALAVSVEITTQFRAAYPREELAPDGPLFIELRTAGSIGGFVDEDYTVWSPSATLLAQGRQLRYVHA
jgi:hypothetical protein